MTEWIKCSERLPEAIHPSSPHYRTYLIWADGYLYVADYTYDKHFQTCYSFHVNGEEMTGVTHWMPLPDAPEVEE